MVMVIYVQKYFGKYDPIRAQIYFLCSDNLFQCVPETPYTEIGQIATLYYFGYFACIVPGLGLLENKFRSYHVNNSH